MNHAELVALVAERESQGKVWVSLPVSDLKELLDCYKKPETYAYPYLGVSLETEA